LLGGHLGLAPAEPQPSSDVLQAKRDPNVLDT
jgi:hypothetical protein